ncbi:hypothetical protein N431DRAFT_472245 [Stipitochalara longipes BDJ]|nr:hypothetical protein N431DRAFT_472245 [Stipitochalara longipes BDJ]
MPPKVIKYQPDPNLITTITEFQLSTNVNISELNFDKDSGISAKWAMTLNPLRNAPGWKHAQWGRLIERPETVLLISDWTSRHLLEDFKNSPEYDIYFKWLSELGLPKYHEVYFPNGVVRDNKYRPSITKIYFPAPVTDQQKEAIERIYGIYTPNIVRSCRFGMGEEAAGRTQEEIEKDRIARASRYRGYYSGFSKGWKLELEERNGVKMEVLIWVYNWFDDEKEQKGKNSADGQSIRFPNVGRGLNNDEVWKAQMIDCGAVEFVEEHWENHYIWETWEKSQREAKARLAQRVNALPLTFNEVFGAAEYESGSV